MERKEGRKAGSLQGKEASKEGRKERGFPIGIIVSYLLFQKFTKTSRVIYKGKGK